MKRTAYVLLSAVVGILPGAAFATGPEVLNLRDGVPRELLGKMLGISWSLFGLCLALGLIVEAFSNAPTQQKNYAGVAWRALVVMALLAAYPKVFGTVISSAETLANRIAPAEIWNAFTNHVTEKLLAIAREQAQPQPNESTLGKVIDGLRPSADFVTAFTGGYFFDTIVIWFVAFAQAFQWAWFQFSRILLSLFYVIGPLALVFHIPGPSQTGGRWFRAFVTIASWPVFSALLLALATSLMFHTNDAAMSGAYAKAFGAVATSLLIVVLNVAVPVLASALIGGGVRNVLVPSLGAAAFAGMKLAGMLGPAVQKLDGALSSITHTVGSALHHAAGSSSWHSADSASGPSAPALAVPPPQPASLDSHREFTGAAPALPSAPPAHGAPGTLTVAARSQPQDARPRARKMPRPPGLSTKDLTLPPRPGDPANPRPIIPPPLVPLHSVIPEPAAEPRAEAPRIQPPPPPPDATKP